MYFIFCQCISVNAFHFNVDFQAQQFHCLLSVFQNTISKCEYESVFRTYEMDKQDRCDDAYCHLVSGKKVNSTRFRVMAQFCISKNIIENLVMCVLCHERIRNAFTLRECTHSCR